MDDDPFGIEKEAKTEESLVSNGRYKLPHPETGKITRWTRVSNFIKTYEDTFQVERWSERNVAKGMALESHLADKARLLDIKEDATALNDIVSKAKEIAGANTASRLGTRLHKMSELADTNRILEVPEEFHGRMAEYLTALADHGITHHPDLMERTTVIPEYGAAGTLDRLGVHKDTFGVLRLRVVDLKTGASLDHSWRDIETQLALYARGAAESGLYDRKTGKYTRHAVDQDTALVVHLPATGTGCYVYELPLAPGHARAELIQQVREERKHKPSPVLLEPAGPDWAARLRAAPSRAAMETVARSAKEHGAWTAELRDIAIGRLPELENA